MTNFGVVQFMYCIVCNTIHVCIQCILTILLIHYIEDKIYYQCWPVYIFQITHDRSFNIRWWRIFAGICTWSDCIARSLLRYYILCYQAMLCLQNTPLQRLEPSYFFHKKYRVKSLNFSHTYCRIFLVTYDTHLIRSKSSPWVWLNSFHLP